MLSVILPCYNPPEHWSERVLQACNALQTLTGDTFELIVVNDGSHHGVSEQDIALLGSFPYFRYVHYTANKGKGYAIREGMKLAKGDLLIYTDIDFPYTNQSFLDVFNRLQEPDCDIAIGIKDPEYYRHVPFLRKAISKLLRSLIRTFLNLPFTDTQCGLKGFKKKVLPVFLGTTINRYLFDLEFIKTAYIKKYSIVPVPVSLKPGVVFRKMNYKILIPEFMNFIRVSTRQKHEEK